jgi:hypothetical protein
MYLDHGLFSRQFMTCHLTVYSGAHSQLSVRFVFASRQKVCPDVFLSFFSFPKKAIFSFLSKGISPTPEEEEQEQQRLGPVPFDYRSSPSIALLIE